MGLDLNSWLTYNGMTLEIIVWSMFFGVLLGSLLIFYNRNVLGAFIRVLLENGATSPSTAKTLEETGFLNNFFVRAALRTRGTYRRIIHASSAASPLDLPPPPLTDGMQSETESEEKNTGGKKKERMSRRRASLSEVKFFIPDNMAARARSIYSDKGINIFAIFMTIGLFLIVAILSILIVPQLIQMLKNFIDMFFGSNS